MTQPLEWSDPPARHVGIWFDLLAPCVDQPRRWALVRVFELPGTAHSTAKDLRRRRPNYPPGAWEFRTRRQLNGGTGLWARYLGPGMSEHTGTIATAPWQTTVTCSCGWIYEHPDPSIAELRHTQHVGIETACKALRKETATE